MLTTVKLNDDCRFGTNEVTDVGTDHVLASELEACQLATAQATPEKAFGVRQV
jgi:hypothetical protein